MRTAIGLMSGTSMDGIDVAVMRTDGEHVLEHGPTLFVPYPSAFRREIEAGLAAANAIRERSDRPDGLSRLEQAITDRHAAAVRFMIAAAPPEWRDVSLIGFHGQTVLHRPEQALTVQLGDGERLAHSTGIPVVFDMRAEDMLAGGQGAPLVPAYHAALARSLQQSHGFGGPIVFVNIGGISNITYVGDEDPIAFDTGPGNTLIDQWVSREGGVPFDAEGAIASEGTVLTGMVERYLDNPFFGRTGPKSLDRSDFTLALMTGAGLADGARTLARVAAAAIVKAAEHLPEMPRLWIIAGGGRKNPHIMADMREALAGTHTDVMLAEEAGLRGDFIEAEAWAYLAVRSQRKLPLTFPTTTGCRNAGSGGKLAVP